VIDLREDPDMLLTDIILKQTNQSYDRRLMIYDYDPNGPPTTKPPKSGTNVEDGSGDDTGTDGDEEGDIEVDVYGWRVERNKSEKEVEVEVETEYDVAESRSRSRIRPMEIETLSIESQPVEVYNNSGLSYW
jgi:hypothetical protein